MRKRSGTNKTAAKPAQVSEDGMSGAEKAQQGKFNCFTNLILPFV